MSITAINYVEKPVRDHSGSGRTFYNAVCEECGREYHPARSHSKFCNSVCASRYHRKKANDKLGKGKKELPQAVRNILERLDKRKKDRERLSELEIKLNAAFSAMEKESSTENCEAVNRLNTRLEGLKMVYKYKYNEEYQPLTKA
jgi:hypothetical protein